MARILVADDNPHIASILEDYLKKEGHSVHLARDGVQALAMFHQLSPDALLLDVMMPGMDGFALCREIRRTSAVPIIMVTARGEDVERIMGLDIGADDYIVKPFSPGEVMARLRAVLRRIDRDKLGQDKALSFGNLRLNVDNYTALVGDAPLLLTKKEIELLYLLASHPGKVFTRENLLDSLWGYDYFGDSRTVDSHIKRLRAKLEQAGGQGFAILTIWGVGYKLDLAREGGQGHEA